MKIYFNFASLNLACNDIYKFWYHMIANIVVNPKIYRYQVIAWNGAELLGINWPLPPKLELSFLTEPWFT